MESRIIGMLFLWSAVVHFPFICAAHGAKRGPQSEKMVKVRSTKQNWLIVACPVTGCDFVPRMVEDQIEASAKCHFSYIHRQAYPGKTLAFTGGQLVIVKKSDAPKRARQRKKLVIVEMPIVQDQQEQKPIFYDTRNLKPYAQGVAACLLYGTNLPRALHLISEGYSFADILGENPKASHYKCS